MKTTTIHLPFHSLSLLLLALTAALVYSYYCVVDADISGVAAGRAKQVMQAREHAGKQAIDYSGEAHGYAFSGKLPE